jgi:hypothetical protein
MITTTFIMTLALIMGDSHASGFPGEVLAKHLNDKGYEVVRMSKVGATVFHYTNNKTFKHKTSIKFAFLGSNDSINLHTVKRYQKLKNLYPNLYVIGPPFFNNPKLDRRSYEISKIQKRIFGKNYLDSRICTTNNSERYKDGVHFTYYGALEWVKCALKSLN